jgi:hypothetical protein
MKSYRINELAITKINQSKFGSYERERAQEIKNSLYKQHVEMLFPFSLHVEMFARFISQIICIFSNLTIVFLKFLFTFLEFNPETIILFIPN